MQLFGTSGIRRLVDINLVQIAFQVGLALGDLYPEVVVARDTRTSGSAISHAVTAGLLAAGAHCKDAGILPTPTLAFLTRGYSAGVMVTASHNPPRYNGLKLINPDGSAFSSQQQHQIEDVVSGVTPLILNWGKMHSSEFDTTAVEKHITRILQDFPQKIYLKIVVDCGCGAACAITPQLLSRMGCEVITLNGSPSGFFPHDVEPIESNLSDLMQAVKDSSADLGIAHDGDADRMMAVDDEGRFISGDKLMAILARASNSSTIVTTIDASMIIDEMGFQVRRTKVGDPYVSEALKAGDDFGGEPSGAWVFPRVSLCPDGIYAAAKIVAIASQRKLSNIINDIPSYPVIRGNVEGSVSVNNHLEEKLTAGLTPIRVSKIDGFKLILPDGWLLVRPSGTEPKVRISAEARSEANARSYYNKGSQIISDYLMESQP
jgi:phosphoglucosamine mutase